MIFSELREGRHLLSGWLSGGWLRDGCLRDGCLRGGWLIKMADQVDNVQRIAAQRFTSSSAPF